MFTSSSENLIENKMRVTYQLSKRVKTLLKLFNLKRKSSKFSINNKNKLEHNSSID